MSTTYYKKTFFITLLFILIPVFVLNAQEVSTDREVDLFWQAQTYTPPLYKGKTLFSPQSDILFVAMPNVSGLGTNDFVYTWKKDGVVLGSKSGRGQNTLMVSSGVLGLSPIIQVEIVSTGGSVRASRAIQVPLIDPVVRLYRKSAALGALFNQTLSTEIFIREEETIAAYPYFFSGAGRESLLYNWRLNSSRIEGTAGPAEVTLRNEGGSGTASLSLSVSDFNNILQRAEVFIRIDFGDE